MEDIIRINRFVTYQGPRDLVEKQIERSIHGVKECGNGVRITAVTIDPFPEVIAKADELEAARSAGYIAGHADR